MIVGEAEVQGQVKRAYEAALAAGTTGPLTQPPVQRRAADGQARAHARPAIGASARERLVRRRRPRARGRRRPRASATSSIIGAGETSELTAQALADQGVAHDLRRQPPRRPRARRSPSASAARSARSTSCPRGSSEADIVVASTSSPHPIVGAEELELVMRARDGRPLLLIDIAVPRDIEPACGELDGVTLYDIDDLQAVVARNLEVREAERAQRRGDRRGGDPALRRAGWRSSTCARRSPRCASTATAIVDQVLAENAGRWEIAVAARPRPHRGDRARGHAAAAARADDPPEGRWSDDGGHGRLQLAARAVRARGGAAEARRRAGRATPTRRRADVRPLSAGA